MGAPAIRCVIQQNEPISRDGAQGAKRRYTTIGPSPTSGCRDRRMIDAVPPGLTVLPLSRLVPKKQTKGQCGQPRMDRCDEALLPNNDGDGW